MTINNRDHEEKRDFIRMKIHAPLKTLIRGKGFETEGICQELSGGGMKIECQQPVTQGTLLEVIVSSEYGQGATLHANTKVVRVEHEGDNHLLALEILEVIN